MEDDPIGDEVDEETIESITADVLAVLREKRCFERLDDELSPADGSIPAAACVDGYEDMHSALRFLRFSTISLRRVA